MAFAATSGTQAASGMGGVADPAAGSASEAAGSGAAGAAAGSESALDGSALGGTGAGEGRLSFADDVYDAVIRARCASCHNDAPSFGGLALFPGGAATAYENLVGVPAGQEEGYLCRDSGLLRVKPGDPDQSLLYLKLTMPSCGKKMPPSGLGGAVTDAQVSLVRQWIADGALP